MTRSPFYPRLLHRLIIPLPLLPPLRHIQPLIKNPIDNIFGVCSVTLEHIKGGLDILEILHQDPHRELLLILVKLFNHFNEDGVESLCISSLCSLLFNLLAHVLKASEIERLSAHWAPVVTPLQRPLFDASVTDGVSADELETAAVFVAHRALHSRTCFELYTCSSRFLAESLLLCLLLSISTLRALPYLGL